jgi:preprotein translocase subunit SecD
VKARRALVAVAVGALTVPVLVAASAAARRKYTVEFRPVITQVPPEFLTSTTTAPVDLPAAKAAVASCDVVAVAQLPVIPTTKLRDAEPSACVVFPDRVGGRAAPRYYLGPAGDFPVEEAKAEFAVGQGWTVRIEFTDRGSKAWDRLGRQQFHKQVAITFEGYVVSAPTIQPDDERFTSFGGSAVISGSFEEKDAFALAGAVRLANGR